MLVLIVATACAGLIAGAAIYITAVEHPARLASGTEVALKEFAPSYHRATMMQASLAIAGCAAGLWAAWSLQDLSVTIAAVCLGAVVPFTLAVILPTNKRCWILPSTLVVHMPPFCWCDGVAFTPYAAC
jgi:Anthrone oxygenase